VKGLRRERQMVEPLALKMDTMWVARSASS
jgi:hypothetical protein